MHAGAKKIVIVLAGVIACGGIARATTIEEIEKKLADARTKLKSYTAKTKSVQDFEVGPGQRMQSTFDGTLEWMKKGEKFLYRSDSKGSMTMPGQPNKMESSSTMISDGEFMYTISEQMGQKSAIKTKVDPHISGDAKAMFDAMREDHTIKVLADAKVDGADCYVVEVVPKTPEGPMAKTLIYFRKDDGMNVKNEGHDPEGKVVFTSTTTDIKVNTEIPADRFVFKAPAGVEVIDMSNQ